MKKKKLRDLTQFESGMSPKKRKSEKEKKKSHDGTMKSVKNELLKQKQLFDNKVLRKNCKNKRPTHLLEFTHKKQETFDEEKVKRLDTI